MSERKSRLRATCAEIRKSLDGREAKDAVIFGRVMPLLEDKHTVFCYVSMGTEADTHAIIRALLSSGKTVLVPHTADGEMTLRLLKSADRLCPDKLGNLPTEVTAPYQGACEAAVVPMLGFRDFYRLGYGGGYYDRFFEHSDMLKIGIAYDEQRVTEDFYEAFDVPLDIIVTPAQIGRRRTNG